MKLLLIDVCVDSMGGGDTETIYIQPNLIEAVTSEDGGGAPDERCYRLHMVSGDIYEVWSADFEKIQQALGGQN